MVQMTVSNRATQTIRHRVFGKLSFRDEFLKSAKSSTFLYKYFDSFEFPSSYLVIRFTNGRFLPLTGKAQKCFISGKT